jgi:hypothetical protein
MIALTQEKREELAKFAKATLNSLNGIEPENPNQYDDCLSEYTQMCMEISLALLTAKNITYEVDGSFIAPSGVNGVWVLDEFGDGSSLKKLFTAPPVPEIKFPSDSGFDSWFKSVEAGDDAGWQEPAYQSVEWYQYLSRRQLAKGVFNFYADEIKRLNGLGE